MTIPFLTPLPGRSGFPACTAHAAYRDLDPASLGVARPLPVIVDGRNIVDPDRFIRAGWVYQGIGRGDRNNHPLGSRYPERAV